MGTKNNPGAFDCYANAEPDEPMFILLARDPSAEFLTAAWVAVRAGDLDTAGNLMAMAVQELQKAGKERLPYNAPKSIEAQQCSKSMRTWRLNRQVESIEARLAGG